MVSGGGILLCLLSNVSVLCAIVVVYCHGNSSCRLEVMKGVDFFSLLFPPNICDKIREGDEILHGNLHLRPLLLRF